ncbi:MAG: hypothetical protein ACP5MV_01925 [Candidatus Parvarchaeum sp.]
MKNKEFYDGSNYLRRSILYLLYLQVGLLIAIYIAGFYTHIFVSVLSFTQIVFAAHVSLAVLVVSISVAVTVLAFLEDMLDIALLSAITLVFSLLAAIAGIEFFFTGYNIFSITMGSSFFFIFLFSVVNIVYVMKAIKFGGELFDPISMLSFLTSKLKNLSKLKSLKIKNLIPKKLEKSYDFVYYLKWLTLSLAFVPYFFILYSSYKSYMPILSFYSVAGFSYLIFSLISIALLLFIYIKNRAGERLSLFSALLFLVEVLFGLVYFFSVNSVNLNYYYYVAELIFLLIISFISLSLLPDY